MEQDWREQLLGIEPEYHSAAEVILSRLDNGPSKSATRSQLLGKSRARALLDAFAKLVDAGVLVELGSARSPVFALHRGEDTAKLETNANPRPAALRAAKAAPVPKAARATRSKSSDDGVPLARQGILDRLAASRAPWLTKALVCGTSAPAKAAYRQLVQDGSIVELGKLEKVDVVTAGRGHAAVDVLRDLAVEVIVTRGTRDALTALPIEPNDPFWKGSLPKQVEGSFQLALRSLLASKRALKLDGAGVRLFVLADSIQAAAAELSVRTTPSVERVSAAPGALAPSSVASSVASTGLDSERVRQAYRSLATRQRAQHVTIADLWRDSGAPLPALKSWLLAECRAHRADPALGEPSLATPEQLAAALEIDGRPHLYIQLENP